MKREEWSRRDVRFLRFIYQLSLSLMPVSLSTTRQHVDL